MSVDPLAIASAFLMHTGSRHISFDLTNAQRALISHPISKMIIMFAMFYISTRQFLWSLVLLILYFVAINVLLNESHPLNMFSPSWLMSQGYTDKFVDKNPEKTIEMYTKNLQALSL
jgi:hypothetical protein